MARDQGRRRGKSRGREGQAPHAHGQAVRKKVPDLITAFQAALQVKSYKHKREGQPKSQKPNKKPASCDAHAQVSSLENDLDIILHEDTLAKHIDPPFAELEDDCSRLKTQSIQLATLVLHLQNQLGSDLPNHKRLHLPKVNIIRKPLEPDVSNSDNIKTTTVNLPPTKSPENAALGPLSIIYSNSPSPRPWSGRREQTTTPEAPKTLKTPQAVRTPRTAGWAGSPMSVQMASPSNTQLTPTLDRLLDEIHHAVQTRDGELIKHDLQVEPPLAQAYLDLSAELLKHYPWGKDQHLRTLCENVLPKRPDGVTNAWESFAGYLYHYLHYIRDGKFQNLLKHNNDIKRLLNTSCICLGDTTFGVIILPSVLYLSKVLARFALGLDKRPELVAQLLNQHSVVDNDGNRERVTFVEDAANTIREAFIKCLSDKSGPGGFGRDAAPEGKRTGIYTTGNLCLKLLFQCGKLSSATTMFVSVDAQSPLLSYYPASQRVTYLYYLGRYLFANNHFFRAQLALQAAYDQCHAQAIRHRQLILVYLMASNICLGRFPSLELLQRREATELANHFLPLCRLIASGDLSGFNAYLSLDNGHAQWFLHKRLLLQLRDRCEPLVWRSLARRVFIEVGFPGGEDNKTPFLRLHLLQAAAQLLDTKKSRPGLQETAANSQRGYPRFGDNALVQSDLDTENRAPKMCDSEFAEMDDAIAETGFDIESGTYNGLNEHQTEQLVTNRIDAKHLQQEPHPTIDEVESIMASLIQQDLINGFLTHNNPRFAIPGAKTRGALAVGFPRAWEVMQTRKRSEEVPGWVKEDEMPNVFAGGLSGGFGGGGRVVNLSGARPVGAGAP